LKKGMEDLLSYVKNQIKKWTQIFLKKF
jgi:hypothetical protein